MPDNPLVSWLNALVSGQAHPWRESLASGAQHGTTTPSTTTTRPEDVIASRELLMAMGAEAPGYVAALDEQPRRRRVGQGRLERLERTVDRLVNEGKLRVDMFEDGPRLRWSPDYHPTPAEARSVGTAYMGDLLRWWSEDERPPDPYRMRGEGWSEVFGPQGVAK